MDNQKIIIEQNQAISIQISEVYSNLDQRLARIEFELGQVAEGVEELVWQDWEPCWETYDLVTRVDNYDYLKYGDFPDFSRMRSAAIAASIGSKSISNCAEFAIPKLSTVRNPATFATFTTTATVSQRFDELNLAPDKKQAAKRKLQLYQEQVHRPTYEILSAYISDNEHINWSGAFASLIRPEQNSTSMLNGEYIPALVPCTMDSVKEQGVGWQINKLLTCSAADLPSREEMNDVARQLLKRPILSSGAIEISEWALLVARMLPLMGSNNATGVHNLDSLAVLASDPDYPAANRSASYRMLEGTLDLLNLTLISQTMLYGDVTTLAAFDALKNTGSVNDGSPDYERDIFRKTATLLNKNNFHLRKNVTVALLSDAALKTSKAKCEANAINSDVCVGQLPSKHALETAVGFALETQSERPFALLNKIFGDEVQFVRTEQNLKNEDDEVEERQYQLFVEIANVQDDQLSPCPENVDCENNFELLSPWPGDPFVQTGRLTYPNSTIEIQNLRSRVFDRMFDMEMLADLNAEDATSVLNAATIISSMASAEADVFSTN